MGSIHEKNTGRKSRDTAPLNAQIVPWEYMALKPIHYFYTNCKLYMVVGAKSLSILTHS